MAEKETAETVAVRAKVTIRTPDGDAHPGDVVELDIDDAVAFVARGDAEPIESGDSADEQAPV